MVALSSRFVLLSVLLFVVSSMLWVRMTKQAKKMPLKNPMLCRIIHHANVLMVPNDAVDGKDVVPTSVTECHPILTSLNDHHHIPLIHEVVDHTGSNVLGPHHVGLYLAYEAHWVHPMTHHITLPQSSNSDEDFELYPAHHPMVQDHLQQHGLAPPEPLHRYRSLQGGNASSPISGKMIVARVRTADEDVVTTADAIANFVFNAENTSFAFIHEACTIGNKVVVPFDPTTPVYEIALSGNSSEYSFGSFFTAAEPLLITLLGLTDVGSLAEVAEYVLLISPQGLRPTIQQPNFRFVAAGAYDSYKVVVTDDWVDTPQVLQHEIGCVLFLMRHSSNRMHQLELLTDTFTAFATDTTTISDILRRTMYSTPIPPPSWDRSIAIPSTTVTMVSTTRRPDGWRNRRWKLT